MIKILKGIKHLHHLSFSLTYLPALTRSLSDSSLAKLTSQTKQVLNTHSISQTSSSSLTFSDRLKNEERRLSPKSKRISFDYKNNFTNALSSPYSNNELKQQYNNMTSLINLSKQYIVEHATRRVDLFFYLLVAYYQTKLTPILGKTIIQHGIGRTLPANGIQGELNLTQACHSSFIPSLVDETIYMTGKKNLLSDTHFLQNLNATVELPPFVNEFDSILEYICRPKCIAILQNVASGELNPAQGLADFLVMMKVLLADFEHQAKDKNYLGLVHSFFSRPRKYVNPNLIELIKEGTLATTFSIENNSVKEEYIQLLLRMNKDEKTFYTTSSSKEREKIYLNKFLNLQEEILQSTTEVALCKR